MKLSKAKLRQIIMEEISETAGFDELNKAMAIIESAYKNEATRETAQQVVDELYRRFGRHEPSPEELEL